MTVNVNVHEAKTHLSRLLERATTLLLLDSQAALWLLDDSPRLGPRARQAIAAATAVHISA